MKILIKIIIIKYWLKKVLIWTNKRCKIRHCYLMRVFLNNKKIKMTKIKNKKNIINFSIF